MTQDFIDRSIKSFKTRESERAHAAIELIHSGSYEAAILALCDAKVYAASAREYEFIADYEKVNSND